MTNDGSSLDCEKLYQSRSIQRYCYPYMAFKQIVKGKASRFIYINDRLFKIFNLF